MNSDTGKPNIYADALRYHERGIACVAVRAKRPVVSWKLFQIRLPTAGDLADMFSHKHDGVAVLPGAQSGNLAIRDWDDPAGYQRFADEHPALARTLPTVKTHRGFHVWFRSDLPKVVKLPDGEYRGAGIVVAPRSLHPAGGRYTWMIPLSAGAIPEVAHELFTSKRYGSDVTEIAECNFSASLLLCNKPSSAISVTDLLGSTVPKVLGERHFRLMDLARGLRFNAGMAEAARDELARIVRQWHELARAAGTTNETLDVTLGEFFVAFERARHPLGWTPIEAAMATDTPEVAQRYESAEMHELIRLCHGLAKEAQADGRFFLSCHVAAEQLNTSPMTVWRLLKLLIGDGVIRELEVGNARRATRYQWAGDVRWTSAGHPAECEAKR